MKVEVPIHEGDVIRLNGKTWDVLKTDMWKGDTFNYQGHTFKAGTDYCCVLNPQVGQPRLMEREYLEELMEYSGKVAVMTEEHLSQDF